MSFEATLNLTHVLTGICFFIQSVEYVYLLQSPVSNSYFSQLKYFNWFRFIIFLRPLIALLLVFNVNPYPIVVALALHILTLFFLGGNFNGGSDFMTTQVLVGLSLASLLPQPFAEFGLWYIAFQIMNSYFVAGLVKMKERKWISGLALKTFLQSSIYSTKPQLIDLSNKKWLTFIASWSVMTWEVLFPISLFNVNLLKIFLAIGLIFHFGNWLIFGLNRFVLAWVAGYPAIIYCAEKLATLF